MAQAVLLKHVSRLLSLSIKRSADSEMRVGESYWQIRVQEGTRGR